MSRNWGLALTGLVRPRPQSLTNPPRRSGLAEVERTHGETVIGHKLGDREVILETGKLAQQAGGAVVVRMGEAMLLVTATASSAPREGVDFFPADG